MKKILFVLPLLAMMVVGCSNPTNTETPEEKKTVQTPVETPQEPETPSEPEVPETPVEPVVEEDKSPYEYVKPDCVNLEDYTYVGDYIFADTMNFAEWMYSNAETEYLLAFEKIARVKNDNPNTRIYRYYHNAPDNYIRVEKATKYKIYVKTSVVDATEIRGHLLNTYNKGLSENYDGTFIRISKKSETEFSLRTLDEEGYASDYIEY